MKFKVPTSNRIRILFSLVLSTILTSGTEASELTFDLARLSEQCFYESCHKGDQLTLEYFVITGGNYDVDAEIANPLSQIIYREINSQRDSFTWIVDVAGAHKICFSNSFSLFSHKLIHFRLKSDQVLGRVKGKGIASNSNATYELELTLFPVIAQINENFDAILHHETLYRLQILQATHHGEYRRKIDNIFLLCGFVCLVTISLCQLKMIKKLFPTEEYDDDKCDMDKKPLLSENEET